MEESIGPVAPPVAAVVPNETSSQREVQVAGLDEPMAALRTDGDSLDQNIDGDDRNAARALNGLAISTLNGGSIAPHERGPLPTPFAAAANLPPFTSQASPFLQQLPKAEHPNPVPADVDGLTNDPARASKPLDQQTRTRLPPISNPSPRLSMDGPSSSRRHHLLRHTLPPELSGENAVHHFGVSSLKEALQLVHTMSQRELQISFEKVYNVRSSSNNNNWLRKKLTEALVPRDSPSSKEVEQILEELAARGPTSRKRSKDWSNTNQQGNEPTWVQPSYRQQMPNNPQIPQPLPQPQTNQRKATIVRPSPVDAQPDYSHVQEWNDRPEPAFSGGRRKRRAAAGVAAATAAVLRDPALEEIERADLRRASSRDYAERRWGTTGGSLSGEPRSDSGGSSGAGVWRQYERPGPPPGPVMESRQNSQQDLTQALNSLTHLLSIAVQQGKLGGGGGGASKASGIGWGNMEPPQQTSQQPPAQPQQQLPRQSQQLEAVPQLQQLLQQLLQQQQQNQQYQPPGQSYDYHSGQYGGSVQTREGPLLGNFGGQRMPQPALPQQPQALAPALSNGGSNGSGPGGMTNTNTNSGLRDSLLGRILAAVGQDRPGAVSEQQVQPQRAEAPQMDSGMPSTAAALMQRALAARVAQVHAQQHVQAHMQQQRQGPTANRGSTLQGALVQPVNAEVPKSRDPAAAGQSRLPTSIPGSTYPVDSLLMQLLQQQAEAQKKASEGQAHAGQS